MRQMIDPKNLNFNFDDKYLKLEPAAMTDIKTSGKGLGSFLNYDFFYGNSPDTGTLKGRIQLNAGEPSRLLLYTRSTSQADDIKIRMGNNDNFFSEGSNNIFTDYSIDRFYMRKYSKTLTCFYPKPAKVEGEQYMLTDKTVKTLFGNSIYSADGTGNIDLYAHDITITKGTGKAFLTVYSSKNTNIASLDDLKTIAGATFTKSCTGYINSKVIVAITETSFLLADGTTEALTGATFVDVPAAI